MATRQNIRVTSSEASIEKGRQAYGDGLHKTAIEHFTLVAHACPCNRGGRRERCKCKDFGKIAREGGDVFHEAMYACSCQVSRKYNKCHETSHVQALDYRAAVFEKMQRLDHAKRDAEWLLEIAPRSLEGYLRLGKIFRLEKEPEVAYAIWSAGVQVGSREGHGGSAKLRQLRDARAPLQQRLCRKDPMQLPVEIVEFIFSYFDVTELSRAQGVCKRWDLFIDSCPRIWRDLEFRASSTPPMHWLKKLAKRTRGDAQSLIIRDTGRFRFSYKRWEALLRASPRVKHLALTLTRSSSSELLDYLPDNKWDGLTSLELRQDAHHMTGERSLLHLLLCRNKDSLANLSVQLASVEIVHDSIAWSMLTRLRFLKLEGKQVKYSRSTSSSLEIIELAELTPCLEQISLSGCNLSCDFHTGGSPTSEAFWSLWPNLEVVRLFANNHPSPGIHSDRPRRKPPLRSMRVFESFHTDWPPFLLPDQGSPPAEEYLDRPGAPENIRHVGLERFWADGHGRPEELTRVLESSVASGTLTQLGLPLATGNFDFETAPVQYFLDGLAWLRGAESIRTLGVLNFSLDSSTQMPDVARDSQYERDQGTLLVQFIGTFPNLETLVLSSHYTLGIELPSIAERVACQGRVKNICVSGLAGAVFDKLRSSASEKGVEVTRGLDKESWPVPLNPNPRVI